MNRARDDLRRCHKAAAVARRWTVHTAPRCTGHIRYNPTSTALDMLAAYCREQRNSMLAERLRHYRKEAAFDIRPHALSAASHAKHRLNKRRLTLCLPPQQAAHEHRHDRPRRSRFLLFAAFLYTQHRLDTGKTTLTAAITKVLATRGGASFRSYVSEPFSQVALLRLGTSDRYEDIDKAPEECVPMAKRSR